MSARRKASCAKTRLHCGFVTPRRRTQRAGADLSSTVQPGSISNPFGSGLHLSRRRPATPAVNLSARTGAVPSSDRRTVVGDLQPPNDGTSGVQVMINGSLYEERMRITHKCSPRASRTSTRFHPPSGLIEGRHDPSSFRRARVSPLRRSCGLQGHLLQIPLKSGFVVRC